jgi:hypothetical protein
MALLGALETRFLAACALDELKRGVRFFLEAPLTSFLAAPRDKFVVVGE